MCRLLETIVNQTTNNLEESVQYSEHEREAKTVVEQNKVYQENRPLTERPSVTPPPNLKRVRLMPSNYVANQSPIDVGPGLPIKEGLVEKKGHSAAFLMWPK